MVEKTNDEVQTQNIEEQLYNIKLGDDNYSSVLEEAEKYKNEGNVFAKDNKINQAIECFTKAIDLKVESTKNSIYLSNRAFMNLKLENYGLALSDANKSIEIDPSYIKAYYRRASAFLFLRKYDDALKDLMLLHSNYPDDADILNKINNTKAERRKLKFLESIQSNETDKKTEKDIFKKCFNTYNVEKTYCDSVYESDNIIAPNSEDPKDLEKIDLLKNFTSDGPAFNAKIDEKWVITLMENMTKSKYIHKKYLTKMIFDVKALFDKDKTLVDITVENDVEISVCGDTHGQYYDLLNIFKINGNPSKTSPYLFNGDFVDRGSFSVDVVIALLAWKLLYPNHFFLSRGNHESKNMNKMYGFEGEVRSKYDDNVYEMFCQLFCSLPLCHVINNKVLVLHGGLFSKDGVTLDDIRAIDRKREPPENGLMCEILWSDPCKEIGRHPSKRGVGLTFGPDVTKRFLDANGLSLVVRSHEVKQEGYEVEADGKLITIFSAPNYCDQMGNKGALIRFKGQDMKPNFVQYTHVEHPKVPPMKYVNPWMMF